MSGNSRRSKHSEHFEVSRNTPRLSRGGADRDIKKCCEASVLERAGWCWSKIVFLATTTPSARNKVAVPDSGGLELPRLLLLDADLSLLFVPDNLQRKRRCLRSHFTIEILRGGNQAAANRGDHISRHEPRLRRGRVAIHGSDQNTLAVLNSEKVAQLSRERIDAHTRTRHSHRLRQLERPHGGDDPVANRGGVYIWKMKIWCVNLHARERSLLRCDL